MIDPVTLAVLKGRLEQIADEMDATLFRSAFNPIIAEAHDASHGLYEAGTGDTLVQGKSGLPIFVGVMAFAVKAAIDKAARDGDLADGDVYIFNDPYDGGTHLSDFKLVRPYFRDGKVFCWLASVGHWHDVGGNVPGNYNPVATESHQEGMHIPPVKLVAGGKLSNDIVDILKTNPRQPLSLYGDLNGQLNALDLGAKRLGELLSEYGADTVKTALAELKARAGQLMRANIAELPSGTYSAEDFLDNDGIVDAPLKIALDLTIKGDTMVLDFSRTALPCAGPVNIARSTAIASCYVALKHIFRDVPANAGLPGAGQLRHPGTVDPVGESAQAGRRLHRDDLARDRRGLPGAGASGAGARQRLRLWHDQRAVAGGLSQGWAALGDVLLLRRRAGWQSRDRRPQSRQRTDFHGDNPTGGDSPKRRIRSSSRAGRCARIAAGRAVIAAGWARSTSSSCSKSRPMCSCSASAANSRHPAWSAAAAAP